MSTELDNLRKEHAKFQARLTQLQSPLSRVGELRDQLAELEATAISPGGKVTVVAGPGGAIRDVRFAEDAVRQSASALAAEVRSTLQQAVAAAARKQAELIDGHLGGQVNAYEQVMQNQAEAFGTTVEELKRSLGQAQAPSQPPQVRDEDDFGANSLMSKGHRPPPPTGSGDQPRPGGGTSSRGDQFLKDLFDGDDR